jgi:hypothetical protein
LAKIAEICDQNVDPFPPLKQRYAPFYLQKYIRKFEVLSMNVNYAFKKMSNFLSFFCRGLSQIKNCSTLNVHGFYLFEHNLIRDRVTRGRCYDHNFLRFSTIFGEKNWRLSQKPMLRSQFLQTLAVPSLSKKRQLFC